MDKKTGKFLAVLVSAACVKYGMDAQNNIVANAAEQQNNSTEISQTTADNMGNEAVEVTSYGQDVTEEAGEENAAETEEVQSFAESVIDEPAADEAEEEIPEGLTEEQIRACGYINDGIATSSDYKLFNIVINDDTAKLYNHALKGKGKYVIRTNPGLVYSIQDNAQRAFEGVLSLEDYQNLLGYTEIDQGYINVVNAKVSAEYGMSYYQPSKSEKTAAVAKALTNAISSFNNICKGKGQYLDYGLISDDRYLKNTQLYFNEYGKEVKALNGSLNGKTFDTLKSLQEHIQKTESVYGKIYRNSGDITKEDIETIGITGVDDSNYNYLLKQIMYAGSRYYSYDDIYLYSTELIIDSINNGYDRINEGKGCIADFCCNIGDEIVDTSNFKAFNFALTGKNVQDKYSLNEEVKKIDGLYADLRERKDVSISDLYNMGFKNITEDAYPLVMENIKSVLEENNYEMTDSGLYYAIQDCFEDSGDVFEKINAGTAKASDFDLFQMKNYYKVDEDNVEGMNLALKGKNIEYNNDLYKAVNEAFDRYYRIGAGIADTSDYIAIGIDNLNDMTAKFVSYKIADMNLQSGCTLTINEIADEAYKLSDQIGTALENINEGTASVDDFTGLEIDGVNDSNIEEVNAFLKDKQCCTLESIIDYLKSDGIGQLPEEEEAVYNKINKGKASLDEYVKFGITKVTADNLKDVNSYLKDKNCFNKVKLQKQVDLIATALENINSASKVTEYYNIAGVDFVENSNVAAVAKSIKNAVDAKGGALTVSEITQVCEKSIEGMSAVCDSLSQGNAGLDAYENLGLEKVKVYNLNDINNALKGIKSYDLILIQNVIDSVADPLKRIDNGTAAVGDYNKLSIAGVTEDNLVAVNNTVKEEGQSKNNELSIAEAASAVDKGIAKYNEIFATILSGTATAADYNYIGLDTINDNNIGDVNEYVKNHNRSITNMKTLRSYAEDFANTLRLINEGTKDTAYYNYSWYGIQVQYSLNKDDIDYVVDAILKAKAEKGRDLHKAEILQIAKEVSEDVDALYIRFDKGTATMDDFKSIGCVDFEESFLSDANEIAKAQSYKDTYDIKNKVNGLIQLLDNASKGTLTYSDLINFNRNYYRKLTYARIDEVNEKTKAAAEEKGSNLTKAEFTKIANSVLL